MNGVLVVDKPRGPTSHDVVVWVRRALDTREVGHAGTLDPMATGVLVVCIGEGTKLAGYLASDEKVYETEIRFGVATDTLDADGAVVGTAVVPELTVGRLASVCTAFVGEITQIVPAVSAVRVAGERLYERARRGDAIEGPARAVFVRSIEVLGVHHERACALLRVTCGKGVYVRALARDVAEKLGTVGHLVALRRTQSGAFRALGAVSGAEVDLAARDAQVRMGLVARVLPLERAWTGARVALTAAGDDDAVHGRPVAATGCSGTGFEEVVEGAVAALVAPNDEIVALARREGAVLRVVRGIARRGATESCREP